MSGTYFEQKNASIFLANVFRDLFWHLSSKLLLQLPHPNDRLQNTWVFDREKIMGNPKSWENSQFFFLVNLVYTYQVIRMVGLFPCINWAWSKRLSANVVVEPNVNWGSNRASNVLKAKKWNVLGLGGNRNYWDEVSIWMVKKGNETKLLAHD